MTQYKYVIGADFGSDSVRAVIVNLKNKETCAEAVCAYPRWKKGLYQAAEKSLFRQHPLDYLEAFETVVNDALGIAGADIRQHVAGIAVDTTGSTPCPVNREGTPLALCAGFEEDPDAMFHLWKDHTAAKEAIEINEILSNWNGTDYTKYQGVYSSEWYWAKILHTSRLNERVRKEAFSWVEHCDWITAEMVGNTNPLTMYRCACGAGHKALWHSEWGGLPPADCFAAADPCLGTIARNYGGNVQPAGVAVGRLSKKWTERLNLPETVMVGGCSFDAHAGAVGAGVRESVLVTNIGTSAVDMIVAPKEKLEGKNMGYACGMAENSIIPGFVGIEAGQATFGDVFAWLEHFLMWQRLDEQNGEDILAMLTREAEELRVEDALIALDWFNGRRYPYANEFVRGAVAGISLGTTPPRVFQSLVIATSFGLKRIVESLVKEGLAINRIIAVGGIPRKSSYIMQTMADILNYDIYVSGSGQAAATGAAIFAGVACDAFEDVYAAQDAICAGYIREYHPNAQKKKAYQKLYEKYCSLGEKIEQLFDGAPV